MTPLEINTSTLARDQLAEVKYVLDQCAGIINTMMGQPLAKLLIVDFDPQQIASGQILTALSERGVSVKLVGM
jgi:hypothetical protein